MYMNPLLLCLPSHVVRSQTNNDMMNNNDEKK